MSFATFKERMQRGDKMLGTFLKTPAIELIEVLSGSGLDFLCLDCEHSPFDRARLDACLAVGRALDFPLLVRVPAGTPQDILMVMDSGAVGVVVPHVDSAAKAAEVAKASRFGHGGRGYAGSSRWAGYATRPMAEVLAQAESETVVVVQVEEPEAVDAIDAIANTDGVDAVFIGPSDLSVCYGHTSIDNDDLAQAMDKVSKSVAAAGRTLMTWVPNAAKAKEWDRYGFSVYFTGSEHAWMLQGAKAAVAEIK